VPREFDVTLYKKKLHILTRKQTVDQHGKPDSPEGNVSGQLEPVYYRPDRYFSNKVEPLKGTQNTGANHGKINQ